MAPAPTTVRDAAPGDLIALDTHIPTGRNDVHARFLRRQQAGEVTYLVAWHAAEPVGTGVIRWSGPREEASRAALPGVPEISNLHVEPRHQGQGVGTAVVRAAEDRVRARGHRRVAIGVGDDNPDAARLYRRLGYADSGVGFEGSYTYFDEDGVEHEVTERGRILVREL